MSDHDLTCVDYKTSYMLNYAYGLQKPQPCNLEKSSHFYLNGLDYLANMFEYSKYVTDEKLRTGEFVEYLTDIFERVRPTNIRYDETTANYLRFFVMGTFASSEEKSGYEAVVHIYENIFIFKPKDPLYLFVILTLNADYQRIAVEDFGNKDSGPIFLININESSSPNDALLSKKFLRRTIEAKLLSIDQIGKKRKVFSDGWAKLERSTFLDSLLTTKPDLENFLQLMENSMFKLLYDIDYRYSFHPFMHGLFYRSALSKLVHYEEVWFSKYMSRWTYTVQVYDQTNGWRN
uniref:Uncharacterized protein n=1 Tax=Romanomermis culicivorax TaxID=13658 RepID=A0A915L8Z3_ROMCU